MNRSTLNLIKAAALAVPLAFGGIAAAQSTGSQAGMPQPESSDTGTPPSGGTMNVPPSSDTGAAKESTETTSTTKKKEKKEAGKAPSGTSGAPETNPPK